MRKDEDIRDDILEELEWDPRLNAAKIGVTVKDGAVTLLGSVSSYAEKTAAERAAKKVKGVRAIAEELEVKLPSSLKITDEDIAVRIAHIFEWNASIQNEKVQAEVRSGIVTLTGEVDWNYQRDLAKRLVSEVEGVTSIFNNIRVKERVAKADLKTKISKALHRNADLEASHINVDVQGGTVTLTGSIRAFYEKKLIEDAVWAAPGVLSVRDNLRLS